MTANEAIGALYDVASDSELPALDELMLRAGFRREDGEMNDADAMPGHRDRPLTEPELGRMFAAVDEARTMREWAERG